MSDNTDRSMTMEEALLELEGLREQLSGSDLKVFSQNRELRQENGKLRAEVTRLTEECVTGTFTVRGLEKAKASLEQALAALTEEKTAWLQERVGLTATVDEFKNRTEKLNEELTLHRSQEIHLSQELDRVIATSTEDLAKLKTEHVQALESTRQELEAQRLELERELEARLDSKAQEVIALEARVEAFKEEFLSQEFVPVVQSMESGGRAFSLLCDRMEVLLGFPGRTMVEQVFRLSGADEATADQAVLEEVFEVLQDTATKLVSSVEQEAELAQVLQGVWQELGMGKALDTATRPVSPTEPTGLALDGGEGLARGAEVEAAEATVPSSPDLEQSDALSAESEAVTEEIVAVSGGTDLETTEVSPPESELDALLGAEPILPDEVALSEEAPVADGPSTESMAPAALSEEAPVVDGPSTESVAPVALSEEAPTAESGLADPVALVRVSDETPTELTAPTSSEAQALTSIGSHGDELIASEESGDKAVAFAQTEPIEVLEDSANSEGPSDGALEPIAEVTENREDVVAPSPEEESAEDLFEDVLDLPSPLKEESGEEVDSALGQGSESAHHERDERVADPVEGTQAESYELSAGDQSTEGRDRTPAGLSEESQIGSAEEVGVEPSLEGEEAAFEKAAQHLQNEEYQTALPTFERLHHDHPGEATYLVGTLACLAGLGRFQEAYHLGKGLDPLLLDESVDVYRESFEAALRGLLDTTADPIEQKGYLLELVHLLGTADGLEAYLDRVDSLAIRSPWDGELSYFQAKQRIAADDVTEYLLEALGSVGNRVELFSLLRENLDRYPDLAPLSTLFERLLDAPREEALEAEELAKELLPHAEDVSELLEEADPGEEALTQVFLQLLLPKTGIKAEIPSEDFEELLADSEPAAFVGALRQALRSVDYTKFFEEIDVLSYDGDRSFLLRSSPEPKPTLLFGAEVDDALPEELRFLVLRDLFAMYRKHSHLIHLAAQLDDPMRLTFLRTFLEAHQQAGGTVISESQQQEIDDLEAVAKSTGQDPAFRKRLEGLLWSLYQSLDSDSVLELADFLFDGQLHKKWLDPIADGFAAKQTGFVVGSFAIARDTLDSEEYEVLEEVGFGWLYEEENMEKYKDLRLRLQRLWSLPLKALVGDGDD